MFYREVLWTHIVLWGTRGLQEPSVPVRWFQPQLQAPTSVCWGQRFSCIGKKKCYMRGKQPLTLENVMRKIEHFQLTAFYGLWISKHRVKWERKSMLFTGEILVYWASRYCPNLAFRRAKMHEFTSRLKSDTDLLWSRLHLWIVHSFPCSHINIYWISTLCWTHCWVLGHRYAQLITFKNSQFSGSNRFICN